MRIKLHLSAIFPALLFPVILSAQDILWEKTYGGKHAEYLYDAIPTPDYGFVITSYSIHYTKLYDQQIANLLDGWILVFSAGNKYDRFFGCQF